MTTFPVFKRMRFFTGFFTTARDWMEGQEYFLEKRKLHNRGLHTPGIIDGLGVVETNPAGLKVMVQPGVALDGLGNEITLSTPTTVDVEVPADLSESKTVFIAIKYDDKETDYVENVEAPQYNGHTRVAELAVLKASQEIPDKETWVELARIKLVEGVTEISYGGSDPGDNEIDLRYVLRAGAVGLVEERLSPDMQKWVVSVMEETRWDFAELTRALPAPSVWDVHTTASTAKILAQAGVLNSAQVVNILDGIANIEVEVVADVKQAYPNLEEVDEFQDYKTAADDLVKAFQGIPSLGDLLPQQLEVSEWAEKLARIIVELPVADTGAGVDTIKVSTSGSEATVTLDASGSKAFGDREIETYTWEKLS